MDPELKFVLAILLEIEAMVSLLLINGIAFSIGFLG